MAQSSKGVGEVLLKEYGPENFKKIEFLLASDDTARARIETLRAKIADKAGHRYTDLDGTRRVVDEVLKEEGVDFAAWRSGPKTRLETDVMDGVLLFKLLPNEVPVYRTTTRGGEAGENGSSWWGFGEKGMEVAAIYGNGRRHMVRTTLGDLRKAGIVRSDEMPVAGNPASGNSVELYHRPGAGGETWTPVAHKVITGPARSRPTAPTGRPEAHPH